MKDHLRVLRGLLAYFPQPIGRPFRCGHCPETLGRWHRFGEERSKSGSGRFRVLEKLGAPYYAFHDRDVAPEASLAASNKDLDAVAKVLKEEQRRTNIKLLWGTACLFSHPRYIHGAATSCNADVFAYAAAQVKKAIEVTKSLGGEEYLLGRKGRIFHASGIPSSNARWIIWPHFSTWR